MSAVETTISHADNDTRPEIERIKSHIEHLHAQLVDFAPAMNAVMQARHDLYNPVGTLLEGTHPVVDDQLYKEPTYNKEFIKNDLDFRGGREYHEEKETFDDVDVDTEKQKADTPELRRAKREFRRMIIPIAQEFGFVSKHPGGKVTDPRALRIGMLESELEPISEPVEAIFVPTAAAVSNPKRLYHAFRSIESGAVKTSRIIVPSCERIAPPAEAASLEKAGFRPGATEIEQAIFAAEDLLGIKVNMDYTEIPVHYGTGDLKAKVYTTSAVIGEQHVQIDFVAAPYDARRTINGGGLAVRADTAEVFSAAGELVDNTEGTVLVVSHDAWIPYQGVIAEDTLGLQHNKKILTTGAYNAERLYFREENGEKILDIKAAEAVVDEMAKVYDDITKAIIRAENEITLLEAFENPVPSFATLREGKSIYRSLPIDASNERYNEPLVNIADLGIAGQSYYSRPNATSGDPIPEVKPEVYLRESEAQLLAAINKQLEHPLVTTFFGGEVELYVEDGTRLVSVQDDLYETIVPNLVRSNHPELSEDQVYERRDNIIAKPSFDPNSPSPHATGGAHDVILRYKQADKGFVPDVNVPMGHYDGETSERLNPDYFEYHTPTNDDERTAQRNRRAFFAIMSGAAFNTPTGIATNPTEWFHMSRGDQLAAYVTGLPAYYSFPPEHS